jgi:hypothetical protein
MADDRTTSKEANTTEGTGSRRIVRTGAVFGIVLAIVLGTLVLAGRRHDDATLEPPF